MVPLLVPLVWPSESWSHARNSCCSEVGKKAGDHISWMEMDEQLLLGPWSVLNFGLKELVWLLKNEAWKYNKFNFQW